jgi:hypothetical protein
MAPITPEDPAVDERTALLSNERNTSEPSPDGQNDAEAYENGEEEDTYNRSQILVLSICSLADPISFFCIVPFVPQMIFELGGIEDSEVGFYAGLIVHHLIIRIERILIIPRNRCFPSSRCLL